MIDSAMCTYCIYRHTGERGEWQCNICHAHYFTERTKAGTINTYRVFDCETTPEQMTAQQQVAIVYACQTLTARGLRFCVDFGWQNAVEIAAHMSEVEPHSMHHHREGLHQ